MSNLLLEAKLRAAEEAAQKAEELQKSLEAAKLAAEKAQKELEEAKQAAEEAENKIREEIENTIQQQGPTFESFREVLTKLPHGILELLIQNTNLISRLSDQDLYVLTNIEEITPTNYINELIDSVNSKINPLQVTNENSELKLIGNIQNTQTQLSSEETQKLETTDKYSTIHDFNLTTKVISENEEDFVNFNFELDNNQHNIKIQFEELLKLIGENIRNKQSKKLIKKAFEIFLNNINQRTKFEEHRAELRRLSKSPEQVIKNYLRDKLKTENVTVERTRIQGLVRYFENGNITYPTMGNKTTTSYAYNLKFTENFLRELIEKKSTEEQEINSIRETESESISNVIATEANSNLESDQSETLERLESADKSEIIQLEFKKNGIHYSHGFTFQEIEDIAFSTPINDESTIRIVKTLLKNHDEFISREDLLKKSLKDKSKKRNITIPKIKISSGINRKIKQIKGKTHHKLELTDVFYAQFAQIIENRRSEILDQNQIETFTLDVTNASFDATQTSEYADQTQEANDQNITSILERAEALINSTQLEVSQITESELETLIENKVNPETTTESTEKALNKERFAENLNNDLLNKLK